MSLKIEVKPDYFEYHPGSNRLVIHLNEKSKFSILPSGIFRGLILHTPLNIQFEKIWNFIIKNRCSDEVYSESSK